MSSPRVPWSAAACIALVLVGCGDESPGTPADKITIDVRVDLGPSCPVQQVGVPCPVLPLTGFDVVATSGSDTVRRALPADGQVTLSLAAGEWSITATAGMSCDTVTVSADGSVDVHCDTGIR